MKHHNFPPQKILVPTDLTEASLPALHFAKVIREQFGGAIHVVHAQHVELPPYFSSGQIQNLKRELKRSAEAAANHMRKESAAALGSDVEISISDRHPVEAILEASQSLPADLIVMATHGRHGMSRFRLGSVAEQILHGSAKPILAVRTGMNAAPWKHILCPVNFTDAGQEALAYAAAIAETGGLRLTVLHAREEGDKPFDCALVPEEMRARCSIEEVRQSGEAAQVILAAAGQIKPGLIVMGAQKKLSVLGELFSSTTERVMQWAGSPLLVVPKIVA